MHMTEKVHIGCSPTQALVFHQEVLEQHLQFVFLFHHDKLWPEHKVMRQGQWDLITPRNPTIQSLIHFLPPFQVRTL